MTKQMNERLARVHEVLAARGRMPTSHVREAAGFAHMPTWELAELVSRGMVVKLPAQGASCEATWATKRQAR